ncbi:MAG: hypothetical protein IIB37_08350 [Gemmatimonadetes bacterium]|nr:hypothetical protein [Gemmatimonadota bacterium]
MRLLQSLMLLTVAFVAACGGGSSILTMTPTAPGYVDGSSISPALQSGDFYRIIIVPPSGTAGVAFQENLAAIERSFIARGLTVISSAITSRVILEGRTRDRSSADAAIQLSEVERALLLARDSNADAVLQIGMWDWVESETFEYGRRYFVEDKDAKIFREVDQFEFERAQMLEDGPLIRSFGREVLAFTGRLIDVENGEVLASFKIEVPTVNVANALSVSYDGDGKVVSATYDWAEDERRAQAAYDAAMTALFDRLANLISEAGN